MKLNKRLLFGIVSIALAAVVALIGIPMVLGKGSATVNIVRVKSPIEKGSIITAEQLETVEVSSHGLPANVATDTKQVVGNYATVDMVAGDYFLPSKVSASSPEKDVILSKLPDGKSAISMSVQSLAGVLSNKLRAEDIVSVYSYVDGEAVIVDELKYVRIIAVSNASGTNIEDAVGDESRMAATVTFLADELQAQKLVEIEKESPMHLVLVSRGNAKRAEELLAEQDVILEDIRWRKMFEETDSDILIEYEVIE